MGRNTCCVNMKTKVLSAALTYKARCSHVCAWDHSTAVGSKHRRISGDSGFLTPGLERDPVSKE